MIPQTSFTILAPVNRAREAELRALLASMNAKPGHADPANALVPFGRLDMVHMARFVILDDQTTNDIAIYGVTPPTFPLHLAFLGDIDGSVDDFYDALVKEAAPGLEAIFSHCEGWTPHAKLRTWLRRQTIPTAANYVNWHGRTVHRAREDAALATSLQSHLADHGDSICAQPAPGVHATLRRYVRDEVAAGRLTLTPDPPTPLAWQVRNIAHLVGIPVLGLALSPVLVPVALVTLLRLRQLEKSDQELCGTVDQAWSNGLADIEDHDVTNQFTAMGSLKPGLARTLMARSVFLAIDYAARHLYGRGGLARVRTIHFARWVFLDGGKRVVFCSNYDGSLEAYMDDFINKVGFGLNLSFSGGIGYPATRWLVLDGCADERKFKEYLRRHQVPTQVWYNAHPGLTAVDLERNTRIRDGLESPSLTDADARAWVALL